MILYILVFLLSVFISSMSQVLLKKAAGKQHKSLLREYLNPWVICGYMLLLGSTVFNISGLRGLSFMNGPVIESFGYVLVLFLSRFLFLLHHKIFSVLH